jgi:hypothetical protein
VQTHGPEILKNSLVHRLLITMGVALVDLASHFEMATDDQVHRYYIVKSEMSA